MARAFVRKLRADGQFIGKRVFLELRGTSQNTPTLRDRAILAAKIGVIELLGVPIETTVENAFKSTLVDVDLMVIDDA